MKNAFAVVGVLVMTLTFCGSSSAQAKDAPKTVTSVLDSGVKGVEGEFVPAAEAMPEDKYGFAPTSGEFKGVRTFAQQIKHVAAVNYMVAAAILQEKPPVELGGREWAGQHQVEGRHHEVHQGLIRLCAQGGRDDHAGQLHWRSAESVWTRKTHANGAGDSDYSSLV
jgi:hypothetical protein